MNWKKIFRWANLLGDSDWRMLQTPGRKWLLFRDGKMVLRGDELDCKLYIARQAPVQRGTIAIDRWEDV